MFEVLVVYFTLVKEGYLKIDVYCINNEDDNLLIIYDNEDMNIEKNMLALLEASGINITFKLKGSKEEIESLITREYGKFMDRVVEQADDEVMFLVNTAIDTFRDLNAGVTCKVIHNTLGFGYVTKNRPALKEALMNVLDMNVNKTIDIETLTDIKVRLRQILERFNVDMFPIIKASREDTYVRIDYKRKDEIIEIN